MAFQSIRKLKLKILKVCFFIVGFWLHCSFFVSFISGFQGQTLNSDSGNEFFYLNKCVNVASDRSDRNEMQFLRIIAI